MRSGGQRSRPDHPPPVFFLDRGLGIHFVADVIREAGFIAYPMAEVYPDGIDQTISDDAWIERASAEGWVALTKDYAIIRDHAHALTTSTLRVFALNNANLSGLEMAGRFSTHLNRIVQAARKPGPYVYALGVRGIDLRWRPD